MRQNKDISCICILARSHNYRTRERESYNGAGFSSPGRASLRHSSSQKRNLVEGKVERKGPAHNTHKWSKVEREVLFERSFLGLEGARKALLSLFLSQSLSLSRLRPTKQLAFPTPLNFAAKTLLKRASSYSFFSLKPKRSEHENPVTSA